MHFPASQEGTNSKHIAVEEAQVKIKIKIHILRIVSVFHKYRSSIINNQHFAGGLTQVWPLKFMLVFVFHETFQWL